MSQYMFGTGQLFATPVGGGAPLRFGALQDVSVDFQGDVKELFGQYQFPLDVARGKTKVTWQANTANVDVSAYNQLFFGQTVTTGTEYKQVINEAHSVPSSTTYTVEVTNHSGFFNDLGVYYSVTGLPLKQVAAGAEAIGKYSVSAAGTYTFHSGDASAALLFNYMYADTTATGGNLSISNQLMGVTPKFRLILSHNYNSKFFTLVLFNCVADKLNLPLKLDDHLIAQLSGQAATDDANRIGFISTTSIAGGGA
jgi:hypothetical protein